MLIEHEIKHEIFTYEHDPSCKSYGLEAAQKLGVEPKFVFKTLVVSLDEKELAVGIVPVDTTLNLKAMAKALGGKKATIAQVKKVENSTGYILGGVSPIGQKRPLRTIIDTSAQGYERIYVSAGKRGLDVALVPDDLCRLLGAKYWPIGS
jgi:Cys-tRNA(Pro)/Cys-tRNA(Cys) deacylase